MLRIEEEARLRLTESKEDEIWKEYVAAAEDGNPNKKPVVTGLI